MNSVNDFSSIDYLSMIKPEGSREISDDRFNEMEKIIMQSPTLAPKSISKDPIHPLLRSKNDFKSHAFKPANMMKSGSRMYNDKSIYEGHFVNERRHGMGLQIYPDNSQYKGAFKDDKPHGVGTYSFKNQSYKGIFVEGEMVSGEAYINNQLIYTGSFETGSGVAEGTCYLSDNREYHGTLLGQKAHGNGTLISKTSGITFQGFFDKGDSVGQGKLTFSNGTIYVGALDHSLDMPFPEGHGELKYGQDRSFEGSFDNGLPRRGFVTDQNGSTAYGEFQYQIYQDRNPERQDFVCFTFEQCIVVSDGQIHEGTFVRDSAKRLNLGDLGLVSEAIATKRPRI